MNVILTAPNTAPNRNDGAKPKNTAPKQNAKKIVTAPFDLKTTAPNASQSLALTPNTAPPSAPPYGGGERWHARKGEPR